MVSGLTFNQLICEFKSRRPCQFFRANAERDYIFQMLRSRSFLVARQPIHVGCSLMAKAPRCERGDDEFNSRQPTQS